MKYWPATYSERVWQGTPGHGVSAVGVTYMQKAL